MKGTIKGKVYLGLMMLFAMTLWLAGCSASKDSGDKVRDLDFSVVGDMDVPDELKNLIAEKQQQPFKLTYSDEQNLYIAVGYGVQPTGGYSISVNELYPEKGENAGAEQSFPYIVIRTEYLENPVVFQ